MMNGTAPANIINHVGLVLDASSSMTRHREGLVQAADALIKHLAVRSTELDQETRISVWTFSDPTRIQCVVWDKDVLRLPSIRPFYRPQGMTALIDATLCSISDLGEIPQRYGDHSFLLYVLTDGQENESYYHPDALQNKIADLSDNWTLAALVPDTSGVHEAKRFGFPAGNVERWDTASTTGATEAGERIRETADTFMTGRARGERSTRTLFSTGVDAVNDKTVKAAGLAPLRKGAYHRWDVEDDMAIREFVEAQLGRGRYVIGRAYYELTKAEEIQPQKELAFMSKVDGKVYAGREARAMVGLPDMHVRVKPDHNPDWRIFVQSTSTNRRLKGGTELLYML
jgi:hypothetical protein